MCWHVHILSTHQKEHSCMTMCSILSLRLFLAPGRPPPVHLLQYDPSQPQPLAQQGSSTHRQRAPTATETGRWERRFFSSFKGVLWHWKDECLSIETGSQMFKKKKKCSYFSKSAPSGWRKRQKQIFMPKLLSTQNWNEYCSGAAHWLVNKSQPIWVLVSMFEQHFTNMKCFG